MRRPLTALQVRYALQLLATLGLVAAPLGNLTKTALLVLLWGATFWPIRRRELAVFLSTCLLFSVMNSAALARGIFRFTQPDWLGMPAWEFLMWGFYVLHLLRVVAGPVPSGRLRTALALAVAFALPFAIVADPQLLFLASLAVLVTSFAVFHERHDWIYAGYMVLIGALVEYVGVWSGQWVYPGEVPGGVPPWFATMWAGVGLFARRLMLPLSR